MTVDKNPAPPAPLDAAHHYVTCGEAVELSRQRGVRIFWRPFGSVNYKQPETDLAEVLEG